VLNRADLATIQREMIEKISNQFNLTLSAAGALLRHCRWQEEEFIRQYKADQVGLAKKAGVQNSLRAFMQPPEQGDRSVNCNVCFDEIKEAKTFGMNCGHRFCIPCWKDYLKNAIETGTAAGGNCLNTNCPGFKCKEIIGEQVFEMLLDENLFKKYRDVLLLSFVDDNDALTWCPGTNCGNVIAFSKRGRTVACSCGKKFCFKCKDDAHAPASCPDAQAWLARDKGSQNLDSKFLLEQTKPCPIVVSELRKRVGACISLVHNVRSHGVGIAAGPITTCGNAIGHRMKSEKNRVKKMI